MSISIKIIASSSAANCYRLDDGQTALLLEAGLPLKKIKEALNFKVSALSGCLITHEHGDHAKAVVSLLEAGIDCYMSLGTAGGLVPISQEDAIAHHRLHIVSAGEQMKIGTWTILPFDTVHDCAEPLGFLLQSGSEKILFSPPSLSTKFDFPPAALQAFRLIIFV